MKRYWIYYDGYDRLFCERDMTTGEIIDPQGNPMQHYPDYVYDRWELGGGRIERKDQSIFQQTFSKSETSGIESKYNDDDDSTPPDGLDEFEYIDWMMTH